MVLVSGSCLDTFCGSTLGDEVLDAVGNPDVEEAYATYSAEPSKRIAYVSASIVSVKAKETTDEYAPSDSFKSILEPKNIFNLEGIILKFSLLLVFTIIKQVFIWCLILLNVLPPELMNF